MNLIRPFTNLTPVRQRHGTVARAPSLVQRDELVVQPRRLNGTAADRDVGGIPRGQPGVVGQSGGRANPVFRDRQVLHPPRGPVPPIRDRTANRASQESGDGVKHRTEIHAAETANDAAHDVANDVAFLGALSGRRVDVGPFSRRPKIQIILVGIFTRRIDDTGSAGWQVYVRDGRPRPRRRQRRLGERVLGCYSVMS